MTLRRTTLISCAAAAGALLAVAVPLTASAHVTVNSTSAAAGSYTVLTFAVAHGCEGSSTTAVTIDIPEEVTSVSPTINPSWDVSKVAADAAQPTVDGHGESATARTGQIVYAAKAPLLDGIRDTFELSVKLPENAAGETLSFPVLQTCEVGETRWDEVATEGAAEPEHPAPTVAVTSATGTAHGHGEVHTDLTAAPASQTGDTGDTDDVVARSLGLGGLVVGAIGIVLAVTARRKTAAE